MHLFWPIPPLGGLMCIVLGFCLCWFIEEFTRYRLKARIRQCDAQLDNLKEEIRAHKQISSAIHEELQQLRFIANEAWQLLGRIRDPDERQSLLSLVERIGQYCDAALRIQRIEELAPRRSFESYIERLRLLDLLKSQQDSSQATLDDLSLDLNHEIKVTLDHAYYSFLELWQYTRGEIFEELTEVSAQDKLEPIRDLFKRAGCFRSVGDIEAWKGAIRQYVRTDEHTHRLLYDFWEQ